MSDRDGFWIENMDDLEAALKEAQAELPQAMKRLLESLGEELLNLAKQNMRSESFSHTVFKKSQHKIKRGKNKGQNRISIKYGGSESRNMIDQGGLWNSFQRGGRGAVWTFSGATKSFRLKVGSNVKYAKFLHDGYTVSKDHWVPGVIDSNGIFRYKKGAKSGIMARARTFKGIPFLEVALKDLEALAPDIVNQELRNLFGRLSG